MTLPAYGTDQQFAAKIEAVFDTPQAIVAGDALGMNALDLEPELQWHESQEHIYGSADLISEIEGKRGGKFSAKCYVKPRTAGTVPDMDPLLRAAGFSVSTTTYSLTDTIESLQLTRHAGASSQEVANGCWPSDFEAEITGNQEPLMTFAGGFASYGGLRGTPTLGALIATGATQFTLAATSALFIRPGALISFVGDSNTGAGYLVTAVSANGLTVTFTPALAGTGVSNSTAVSALYPATPSIGGTIQGGIACGLTFSDQDGSNPVSVGFISYKIKVSTGRHGLDREANVNRPNRLARGKRSVTGEIMFYALDENTKYAAEAWSGTLRRISARAGADSNDNRCVFLTPSARINVTKLDLPDAEEATFAATFVARRYTANNDSLQIIFS